MSAFFNAARRAHSLFIHDAAAIVSPTTPLTLPTTPTGAVVNHDTKLINAYEVEFDALDFNDPTTHKYSSHVHLPAHKVAVAEVSIDAQLSKHELNAVRRELNANVMHADIHQRLDFGLAATQDAPLPAGERYASDVLAATSSVNLRSIVYVHFATRKPDYDDSDVVLHPMYGPRVMRLEIRVVGAVFFDESGSVLTSVTDEKRGTATDMFLKNYVKRCLAERFTAQINEFQRAGPCNGNDSFDVVDILAWHPERYPEEGDGKYANLYKGIVELNRLRAVPFRRSGIEQQRYVGRPY